MTAALHAFLNGAATMGFFVVTAFFVRFWRETGDRLFFFFAAAFAAMAVNRAMLLFLGIGREHQPYLYVIRLLAFVLIAWAVVDKNRRG